MKKNILLLFCLLGSFFSFAQTVQSFCSATASVINLYEEDAAKLTLAKTLTLNSTYKDSIKLDTFFYGRYLAALLAVYNATALTARDTVVNLVKIHYQMLNQYLSTKQMILSADSNLIWMKNIKKNILPCGNPALDSLISVYYFKWLEVYPPTNTLFTYIRFSTDSVFNMKVLANKFNLIPGLSAQELVYNYSFVGGGQIKDSIATGFIQLTYSMHWDGCLSGCVEHSYWKFRIYNNCSVQYMGHSGSSIYTLFFNGIDGVPTFKTEKQDIQIFPNPVKDKLSLQFENTLKVDVISISNALGQVVYSMNDPQSKQDIDLGFLQSGIYFLTLRQAQGENKTGKKVFKIVKE